MSLAHLEEGVVVEEGEVGVVEVRSQHCVTTPIHFILTAEQSSRVWVECAACDVGHQAVEGQVVAVAHVQVNTPQDLLELEEQRES